MEQLFGKPGIARELVGFLPITTITKRWLRNQDIEWDRLVVERRNKDTRDPLFNTGNFVISARKQIRAFVEDDLNKARRLCDICEVVFLIRQPYNQLEAEFVRPKNLTLVDGWSDIRDFLRRVF